MSESLKFWSHSAGNLTLGETIAIIRKRAKMSQSQLAKKSKLSRGAISLIERDSNVTLSTLIAIGAALGFTVDVNFQPKVKA